MTTAPRVEIDKIERFADEVVEVSGLTGDPDLPRANSHRPVPELLIQERSIGVKDNF
jgi:hypothetical protein